VESLTSSWSRTRPPATIACTAAFTDEALFELEMKHIFEGNWIYLAHESQIPNNNDYYTTHIGRQPIFIARNRQGELNAFINACSHRGAMLCRHKRGNKATYTCPFHGWTFNNSGKLLKVKDPKQAGYPECFNKEGSHDLKKVARFANYRGFLFGSLNATCRRSSSSWASRAHHRHDRRPVADGLEVLRGSSTYIRRQLEAAGRERRRRLPRLGRALELRRHHNQRKQQNEREDKIRAMDAGNWGQQGGGFYAFDHGHMLLWTRWANPEDRPNFARRDEFAALRRGRADWMIENSRNLCLYPNVYLMDQFGSQIRCCARSRWTAPKSRSTASPEGRIGRGPRAPHPPVRGLLQRQRHGHARRPGEFRACQQGYAGQALAWNDMCRGATHWIDGPTRRAQIGLNPLMSGVRTEDEGLYTCSTATGSKR
jgi:benzoate/toluate 1,2-dioxygenase alpha subunit